MNVFAQMFLEAAAAKCSSASYCWYKLIICTKLESECIYSAYIQGMETV